MQLPLANERFDGRRSKPGEIKMMISEDVRDNLVSFVLSPAGQGQSVPMTKRVDCLASALFFRSYLVHRCQIFA